MGNLFDKPANRTPMVPVVKDTGVVVVPMMMTEEERTYNSIADALLKNDPILVPMVKANLPPKHADELFRRAMVFLVKERAKAIMIAKTIGFARPGIKGDAAKEIAHWVLLMARASTVLLKVAAAQVGPTSTDLAQHIAPERYLVLGSILLLLSGGLAFVTYNLEK